MHSSKGGLCDVESVEVGGNQSPPPPYNHHQTRKINELLKTKGQWTTCKDLALSSEKEQQIAAEVLRVWEDASSWKEFTNNTTFHGVKHIFEDSPFRLRRILWVLSFLTAVIFFVTQVSIRMADYYKYNTNVDVQVQYVTSINFPSVTICNQNSFRMTKVVKDVLYDFVDDVFASNIEDVNFEQYKQHDSVNSTSFLENSAHQLEDLIDSCYWNAEKCDMAKDFKKVFTDMGICYTFNHDSSNIKMAEESGAGYGLRLILNVEQYEAMRGPQNDAGLKLLLHSPDEFPAVKDLGFSVAPGTHSLVGVYYKQVSSLPPPWGICSTTSEPMTTCKMSCKMKMVERKCGCLDSYMHSDKCNVCPLTDLWGCVRNVTEMVKPSGDKCNCTLPCERNVYEPRLSYAQLSRINIDRMVLKDSQRKDTVTESFETALETLQRVDKTIATADETKINNILGHFETLTNTMSQANTTYGSESPIEKLLTEGEDIFKHDIEYLGGLEDYFENLGKMMKPEKIDMAKYLLDYLNSVVVGEDLETQLQDSIQCAKINTLPLPLPDHTDPDTIVAQYMSGMSQSNWSPQDNMDRMMNDTSNPVLYCNSHMIRQIQIAQQFYYLLSDVSNYSMIILDTYNQQIDTLFNGSGRDPYASSEHGECIKFINESYVPMFVADLDHMINVFEKQRKSANNVELEQSVVALILAINDTEVCSYTTWLQSLKTKCFWVSDILDSDRFENSIESGEKGMKYAYSSFQRTESQLTSKVQKEIEEIKELISEQLENYMNITSIFLNEGTRKLNMANILTSMEAVKAFGDLIDLGTDFKSEFTTYIGLVDDVKNQLVETFKYMFNAQLPVITESSLTNFKVLQMMKDIDKVKAEPLISTMVTSGQNGHNLADLFDIFRDFTYGQDDFNKNVVGKTVSKLTDDVSNLQSVLSDYKETATMDEDFLLDNFLQVDIFFSELSYDKIEQHKAFELVSLFSEVGGFLGLLLGASLLSVIEFLDYVGMLVAKKWKQGGKVNGSTTNVKPFKAFT